MKRAQTTLASTGFEKYTKTTRRAQFLAEMDRVVPWRALCARIEPVYPKTGNGRPPVGLERMLRMYFLQHWFELGEVILEGITMGSSRGEAVSHLPAKLASILWERGLPMTTTKRTGSARATRGSRRRGARV